MIDIKPTEADLAIDLESRFQDILNRKEGMCVEIAAIRRCIAAERERDAYCELAEAMDRYQGPDNPDWRSRIVAASAAVAALEGNR